MTLPNGVTVTYGYDSLNRLTAITHTQGSSNVLARYTYTLGLAGNRTKATELDNTSTEWSYDDSYRLTNEVRKNSGGTVLTTTTFAYDKTGNRNSITTTVGASNTVTNSLYNELDELLGEGNNLYSYDTRGNVTTVSGGTSYTWDVMDHLIRATVGGNSGTYLYDPDGNRVKQTIGSVITNYLWDPLCKYGQVLVETDSSNAIQADYTLGNEELISQKRSSSSNTEYFLMDGHSGIRSLTNNSGVISESYRYDAFGNLQNSGSTPNSKYLYTAQQFDQLTGLYDLRARYYNPNQGRFLSRDSYPANFRNPVELNRYGYTADSPINYADPSGYAATTANPANRSGGSEYGAILAALVNGFLVSGIIVLGRTAACLLALDVSSVIASTGGDPDVVPVSGECKVEKRNNKPCCTLSLGAAFVGGWIPLYHTYLLFEDTCTPYLFPAEGSHMPFAWRLGVEGGGWFGFLGGGTCKFEDGPLDTIKPDWKNIGNPFTKKEEIEHGSTTCAKKACIDAAFAALKIIKPPLPYTAFPSFPFFTGINCNVLTTGSLLACGVAIPPLPGPWPAPGWNQ